jgi:Na+/proline symporter
VVSTAAALGLTVLTLALFAGLGVWYSRGRIRGVEDLISARDSVGDGRTTATLIASVMGVWILLSAPEAGAGFGIAAVVGYAVGEGVPMLAYAALGPRIRRLIPEGHSLSEYAFARYGGAMYAFVLAVSALYMFVFLAAELTGISRALALVAGVPQWQTAVLVGGFVTDTGATWAFLLGLVENSLFLLVASFVVFVTYHLGVLLTNSTRGLLQSMHTVAYSTGVYMAVIFTVTWSLEVVAAPVARTLVRTIQLRFLYFFIDVMNAPLGRPFGPVETVDLANLTTIGQVFLAAEVVGVLYLMYSLYLGTRLNHRASRAESLIATAFVVVSPALYVIGNILLAVSNPGITL